MKVRRLLLGAAIGGAAMYFFDPVSGDERRQRLRMLWQENKGTVLETTRTASQTAQHVAGTVGEVGGKVGEKVAEIRARGDEEPSAPVSSVTGSARTGSGPSSTPPAGNGTGKEIG